MSDACVFCDRSNFANRIVSEWQNFYIVSSMGQISGGYLLLIPKNHVECVGAMSVPEIDFFEKVSERIAEALGKEYGIPVVIFEHGIIGQTVFHAHIHLVPAVADFTRRAKADFPNSAVSSPASFSEIGADFKANRRPYIYWKNSDGSSGVCWDPPAQPMYLRIALADILDCPERANWRTMDRKLDNRLIFETVARMKKYFV